MSDFLSPATQEMMLRIFLAAVLGAVIGFERFYKRKEAGIRTHALVAMGSALFTAISIFGFENAGFRDPARVAAQIVVGIGFLGAGLIFLKGNAVRGLTTAAGVWAAAAIGMAAGVGFFAVAIYTTIIALFLLWGVRLLEKRLPRLSEREGEEDGDV